MRLSEQWDFTLKFPDPRPFIQKHGLAPTPFPVPLMGKDWGVERAELDIQDTERWTKRVSGLLIGIPNRADSQDEV